MQKYESEIASKLKSLPDDAKAALPWPIDCECDYGEPGRDDRPDRDRDDRPDRDRDERDRDDRGRDRDDRERSDRSGREAPAR